MNRSECLVWTIAVVLVTLKFTGDIDWSWWLILSPLWVPALFVLVILIIVAALAAGNKD